MAFHGPHGILPVLGGIANIACFGFFDRRKALFKGCNNSACIIHTEGSLGHIGEFVGGGYRQPIGIFNTRDQMHLLKAPAGAFHLWVAGMADEMSSYFRRIKQQRQEQLEKEQAEKEAQKRMEKEEQKKMEFTS